MSADQDHSDRLNMWHARRARDAIAAGEISATDLVEACLSEIDRRDPDVRAWTYLDPAAARAQAAHCDQRRASGEPLGPLHGLPVGIKDIIATADMPTENGSAHFIGHQPDADAQCVATLRAAGAIIMGKTVTTELATRTPGKTRNPHNLDHTPGGSSSGSAAAVAANMVPLALGTQTGGSVVRPASFCGIYGLKPTLGLVPRPGVTLQSHTLDTVGTYGRSLDDLALLTAALDVVDPADEVSYARPPSPLEHAVVPANGTSATAGPFRIGFARTPAWASAEPNAAAAIETLVGNCPFAIENVTFSGAFEQIVEHHQIVQACENTLHFGPLFERDPNKFSDGLRKNLEVGAAIPAKRYLEAMAAREPLYRELKETLSRFDAVVCLSSTGPAPVSLDWTGDPIFNGLWTYLGVPTVTLPLLTVDSLPCGVTLVGARRADRKLLAVANWFEQALKVS